MPDDDKAVDAVPVPTPAEPEQPPTERKAPPPDTRPPFPFPGKEKDCHQKSMHIFPGDADRLKLVEEGMKLNGWVLWYETTSKQFGAEVPVHVWVLLKAE